MRGAESNGHTSWFFPLIEGPRATRDAPMPLAWRDACDADQGTR
jgi:hypothetical protein